MSFTKNDATSHLRKQAHAFCQALITPLPPSSLLAKFFTSKPSIYEHGPSWSASRLPFLGYPFNGFSQCEQYFSLLSNTLKMQIDESSFPGPNDFVVDLTADGGKGVVTVVGRGRFESIKTGRSWEERFVYVLGGWDAEGKIGSWDIWADPLSAWVAVGEEDVEGWSKGEYRT